MCSRGHSETEERGRMLRCRADQAWKASENRKGEGSQIKMIPQLLDGQKPQLHSAVTLFIQGSEVTSFSVLLLPNGSSSPTSLSAGNLGEVYIPLHSQACQRKQCYSERQWWHFCLVHGMPSSGCPPVTLSLFGHQLQTSQQKTEV